jgi:hypothetical protein
MKPGALGVIHFIGHVGVYDTEFYIRKHIFPGGWIPSLSEAIAAMERHGLEVIDVENLRRHYAPTLDAWATRFEENWAGNPRAGSCALRRAFPPHLANVPVVVRGNVPLAERSHASIPSDGVEGQHLLGQLPDEPRVSVSVTTYEDKRAALAASIAAQGAPAFGLDKSTSNLFRDRAPRRAPRIDLSHFNRVISVGDGVVEVEGMTRFVDLADATLAQGAMPAVVPQLKSITIGGAVAGVGIEATSFRHGLVHETIAAMDVLTGDGRTLTCTPDNAQRDLFFGMPNSYGTLGYTLRVTAKDDSGQALRRGQASQVFRRGTVFCRDR